MMEESKEGADDDDEEGIEYGILDCNTYQAATMNKLLPYGFKIDQ